MNCGVGHRRGSDLLWLWPAAVAPMGPLAWEFPLAAGAVLKKKKKSPIALALVAVEAQVQSPAQYSGLKDTALLQLWGRLQPWLRFSPWL